MFKKFLFGMAACTALAAPALATQFPININLINTGGVEQNTYAYYGFNTAARYWESVLTTSAPVTINLQVGFKSLDPGILGQTGSTYTAATVAGIESRLKATGSTALDAIVDKNLPALGNGIFGSKSALSMYTPGYTDPANKTGIDNSYKVYDTDGSYNNSVIGLTTANAKALGYNIDPTVVDGSITFSSDFNFDFTPADGIANNSYDFLAVAIHEIGHALGFVSGVDDYDVLGVGGPAAMETCFQDGTLCENYPANDDWFGETLDLFRYSANKKLDWTTGTDSYFSIDGGASVYKNGYYSTGAYNGDGSQASHWIDNEYAPRVNPACSNVVTPAIGIMNPTMGNCEEGVVTALDISAFDAIGYNTKVNDLGNYAETTGDIARRLGILAVPEPSAWAMMVLGFGVIGAGLRTRRRVVFSA